MLITLRACVAGACAQWDKRTARARCGRQSLSNVAVSSRHRHDVSREKQKLNRKAGVEDRGKTGLCPYAQVPSGGCARLVACKSEEWGVEGTAWCCWSSCFTI